MNNYNDIIYFFYKKLVKYPFDEGGIAFQREFLCNDTVLDHWHIYEKAKYPEFFAKREELKEEYLLLYEETYGNLKEALHITEHRTFNMLPHDYEEQQEKLKNEPKELGEGKRVI